MPVKLNELIKLGFIRSEITINMNDYQSLVYNFNVANDVGNFAKPGVYLILKENHDENEASIIYVGKAGKGLNKRYKAHSSGYLEKLRKGLSSKGLDALKKQIVMLPSRENLTANIWFKASRELSLIQINPEIKDQTYSDIRLSTYSLEEEAFIIYFKALGEVLINSTTPNQKV